MDTTTKEETQSQGINEVPVVLDVGSGVTNHLVGSDYNDWKRMTLDINPNLKPDICADLRKLTELPDQKEKYDAVFCSHVIEHFNYVDIQKVLKSIRYVLKPDGWLDIICPNIMTAVKKMVDEKQDLDYVLYQSGGFGVRVLEVLYGIGNTVNSENFENDFMSHKYGFTRGTLIRELHKAGFPIIDDYSQEGAFDLRMIAFKKGIQSA